MSVEAKTSAGPAAMALRLAQLAAGGTRILLGLALIVMVLLNVANAIGRYAFGRVYIGTDELLVFAMTWLVMLGILLVTAEGSHIALEFLADRVRPRTRSAILVLHHAVMTLACAYAAYQSFAFVQRMAAIGQTSMALGIPMFIPHSALIVGFGGTALIAAILLIRDLATLIGRDGSAR